MKQNDDEFGFFDDADRCRTWNKGQQTKEFDKHVFEGLCKIQCTCREIVSVFRTSRQTLDKWAWRTYGQGLEDVRE
jgi:hypothetical protein